jgi:peptide/nickel transport system permease protein
MLGYAFRRFLYMLVLLVLVSAAAFTIIQLPPGDYVDILVAQMEARTGTRMRADEIQALRVAYGVDRPMLFQYFKWVSKLVRGDFGISIRYERPVIDMLAERLPLTVIVALFTMIFTYIVAIPIGIYSATHQYSFVDYFVTGFGFIGLATPNFLLALLLMFFLFKVFDFTSTGLFSFQYMNAPWSMAKFVDLLKHLPVPVIVIGTAGTAGLIRVLRGTLLDELRKQYVITARAKGLPEIKLLFKYPVRVAINPLVSTIGWTLPWIFSGATITSIVLNLPTTGPLLFEGLLKQDMELAGSIIMILSFFTVIGTFLSDILLVAIDPRIRYEKSKAR